MTDPQEAAPGSSTEKGMDYQSALHLNTFSSIYMLQVSKKKGVLDCTSEITKGLAGGRGVFQPPWGSICMIKPGIWGMKCYLGVVA